MSTFGRIHFLRRQRRFALGEFPSPSIGAFEDFESQTLVFGGPERGWNGPGVVYTYAALVAFENYETSTITSTVLPDFGWNGGGFVTLQSASASPATVAAPLGATAVFTAVIVTGGVSPFTYQWRKGGVNLSNGGVVSGATTSTLTLTGITSGEYANYDVVVTDALGRSATSTSATLESVGTDWSNRVVANGGATPSGATVTAIDTFVNGLFTDGILSKVKMLNVYAPDSLTAALTPLIKGPGSDPWTNHSFVSGDLTVNGLVGNGSTKYLDTGGVDSSLWPSLNSMGIITYYFTAPNESAYGSAVITSDLTTGGLLRPNSSGAAAFHSYDGSISGTGIGAGFYSGQRTASNAAALYSASSGHAHSAIVTGSGATTHAARGLSAYCFQFNNSGPFGGFYATARISCHAFTSGLTATESSNFFTRFQTLRTSFGGGFV